MSRPRTPKSDSDEGSVYEYATDDASEDETAVDGDMPRLAGDELSDDELSVADMSSDVDADVCPDSPGMIPSGKAPGGPSGPQAVPDLYNGNSQPASFYLDKIQRFQLDPELKNRYKRKKYAHRTTKGLAGVKYSWTRYGIDNTGWHVSQ